ncbi:MAG TPA: TetR/AcrR family transcriptional regulator [Solirubrobacteraceae bacterium]|nr:TetR/AcrR family transcriptional regulator [Solirubrobacteraceae bacterium]HVP02643.1 TetR/AcrR family transcriptional regulator [Solirubrobacteraceae bacterium]
MQGTRTIAGTEPAGSGDGDELAGRRSDYRRIRRAILNGAAAVLAEDPGASSSTIAQACGVHRATLFRHFPSRERLTNALLLEYNTELCAAMHRPEPDELMDRDELVRVTDAMVGAAMRWCVLRYVPLYAPQVDQERARVRHLGRGIIAAARRTPGLLRDDVDDEVLLRAWLTPLVTASAPEADPLDVRRAMLVGILRQS